MGCFCSSWDEMMVGRYIPIVEVGRYEGTGLLCVTTLHSCLERTLGRDLGFTVDTVNSAGWTLYGHRYIYTYNTCTVQYILKDNYIPSTQYTK